LIWQHFDILSPADNVALHIQPALSTSTSLFSCLRC